LSKNNQSLNNYPTTLDEMNFFSNHFNCFVNINQTFNCSEIIEIVPSYSFLGKCNTFLFKLSDKFGSNDEMIFRNKENLLSLTQTYLGLYDYLINSLYIHSTESMPSLSHYDWINSYLMSIHELEFSEYNFKKLEYPYDTDCTKYENKTRAQCLNDCYIRKQIKSKKCVKNEEFLIMFNINKNGFEPDIKFCSNDRNLKNNSFLKNQMNFCYKECPVSCEEQIFIIESSRQSLIYSDLTTKANLNFYKNYYIDIKYSPNMLFIGVANLMYLWHGLDFASIRDQFFTFIVFLLNKTKVKIIF
jgi:hypothetical protein